MPTAEAEPPVKDVSREVVAELNSNSSSPATIGPYKLVTGIALDEVVFDRSLGKVTARLVVSSEGTGLHEDDWKHQREFRITSDDVSVIAAGSSRFRKDFDAMAQRIGETLEAGVAAVTAEREAWYGQGLPVDRDVAPLRVFRFKPRR
jgi:hypothetical protein